MKTTIFYNFITRQNLLFVLLLIFCVGIFQAQTTPEVLWAKRYGGINTEGARDIATDIFGNIYITGFFWYETDFEGISLSTSGISAAFVTKTNSSGDVLWAKQFGGSFGNGAGITTDNVRKCIFHRNFYGYSYF